MAAMATRAIRDSTAARVLAERTYRTTSFIRVEQSVCLIDEVAKPEKQRDRTCSAADSTPKQTVEPCAQLS